MRSKKLPHHGANSRLNRHLILWFKSKSWTSGNSKRDDKNLATVLKVWALSDNQLWYTSPADESFQASTECARAPVWYKIKMNTSGTSTSLQHDVDPLNNFFRRATLSGQRFGKIGSSVGVGRIPFHKKLRQGAVGGMA